MQVLIVQFPPAYSYPVFKFQALCSSTHFKIYLEEVVEYASCIRVVEINYKNCVRILINLPTYMRLYRDIYFQPSHSHVYWDSYLNWLPVETLASPFPHPTLFCHLVLAAFLCQNYLHHQWLTLKAEPRVFDTAIVCRVVAVAHAVVVASSFGDTGTSSFKNETEYVFILRLMCRTST